MHAHADCAPDVFVDEQGRLMDGVRCRLRPYRPADAGRLALIADDLAVARWMTAAFPNPYSLEAAQTWVALASRESPVDSFAIEVGGELAGGVGIGPKSGEHAGVAEFGYWLAPRYWGRGIATEAARLLAAHAFAERGLRRLEAHVFAPNLASARVLEKCGFVREAVLRRAYVERDGAVVDGLLYAKLAPAPA
jgi:RimJ/RimL family protein N-acetyltransferase